MIDMASDLMRPAGLRSEARPLTFTSLVEGVDRGGQAPWNWPPQSPQIPVLHHATAAIWRSRVRWVKRQYHLLCIASG
jgi:hypothetical protein